MYSYELYGIQTEIAEMLESTVEQLETRSSVINPASLLIDFHDLVNRRLSINLAILEIILYSSMGVNPLDNDYALPKSWTESGVGVMRKLIFNRSLSAAMGYQHHRDTFIDPLSYINKNRLDHPFDGILMPDIVYKK